MQLEAFEKLGRLEEFSDERDGCALILGPSKLRLMVAVLLLRYRRAIRYKLQVLQHQGEQLQEEFVLVAHLLWISLKIIL